MHNFQKYKINANSTIIYSRFALLEIVRRDALIDKIYYIWNPLSAKTKSVK